MTKNPFGVLSPEQLDANYIAANFVDVFTDLPRVRELGNTFISGARGTGKSMLLRSLEPEVLLKSGRIEAFAKLEFFGVHVPLRKAEFGAPELRRLAGYSSLVIGEHLLIMQICYRIAATLEHHADQVNLKEATLVVSRYFQLLSFSGSDEALSSQVVTSADLFSAMKRSCERQIIATQQYYKRLPFAEKTQPYNGTLTGFLEFLVPLAEIISSVKLLHGVPIFVMLDDADNLPVHLQKVMNSWISTRSTHAICLKISTQLAYATYKTTDERIIESPHDFSEVNLSSIYTTDADSYFKRVEKIVTRRLELAGLTGATPDSLFPPDFEQLENLRAIKEGIEREHSQNVAAGVKVGPARARDQVARTAIPTFMRQLAGSAKSSHTFSYAGFDSLVNLSSGVVRWFLEPASRMFDKVLSENGGQVDQIPVKIQDQVVDEWAREFLQKLAVKQISEFHELTPGEVDETDSSLHATGHETELYDKLKNLVDGLGHLFRQRILDPAATEQRLLSVILRGRPSQELSAVLALGVRLGYLQKADYAAKESLGLRQARYILSRRLGPYYKLDISGYAAHLSVTAEDMEYALNNPIDFVRRRMRQSEHVSAQLPLDLERE